METDGAKLDLVLDPSGKVRVCVLSFSSDLWLEPSAGKYRTTREGRTEGSGICKGKKHQEDRG